MNKERQVTYSMQLGASEREEDPKTFPKGTNKQKNLLTYKEGSKHIKLLKTQETRRE
jgi:hypothetical protein